MSVHLFAPFGRRLNQLANDRKDTKNAIISQNLLGLMKKHIVSTLLLFLTEGHENI
jgi:hypothetical protein